MRAKNSIHTLLVSVMMGGCLLSALAQSKAYPDPVLESDHPDAKSKIITLPVLADGPGKGYYMFFEERRFDAAVDQTGALLLRLKGQDGKPLENFRTVHRGINTSWNKVIGHRANGRPITQSFGRHIKEIKEAPEPALNPRREISIRAILLDDVEFVRRFSFDRDGVTVKTGFKDKEERWRSQYRSTLAFPRIMTFDNFTPQPEREEKLKGYAVTINGQSGRRGDKVTYDYAKSVDFPSRADLVEAKGPWERLTLRVLMKDFELIPNKYKGTCPYEGYNIYHNVSGDGTTARHLVEWRIEVKE